MNASITSQSHNHSRTSSWHLMNTFQTSVAKLFHSQQKGLACGVNREEKPAWGNAIEDFWHSTVPRRTARLCARALAAGRRNTLCLARHELGDDEVTYTR